MDLVTNIYQLVSYLPSSERYGLVNQMRRAAVSVPSNIAEGFGRRSDKDFSRFLNISMSSLFELQTQIEIGKRLKFISSEQFNISFEISRELERMLSSFMNSIKNKTKK